MAARCCYELREPFRPANHPLHACHALRHGGLLDISEAAARDALIEVHTATTLDLWRDLAGDTPFRAEDGRIKELCYAIVFAAVDLIANECTLVPDGREMPFMFKFDNRSMTVRLVMAHGNKGEVVAAVMQPRQAQPKPGASPGAGQAG